MIVSGFSFKDIFREWLKDDEVTKELMVQLEEISDMMRSEITRRGIEPSLAATGIGLMIMVSLERVGIFRTMNLDDMSDKPN